MELLKGRLIKRLIKRLAPYSPKDSPNFNQTFV